MTEYKLEFGTVKWVNDAGAFGRLLVDDGSAHPKEELFLHVRGAGHAEDVYGHPILVAGGGKPEALKRGVQVAFIRGSDKQGRPRAAMWVERTAYEAVSDNPANKATYRIRTHILRCDSPAATASSSWTALPTCVTDAMTESDFFTRYELIRLDDHTFDPLAPYTSHSTEVFYSFEMLRNGVWSEVDDPRPDPVPAQLPDNVVALVG